MDGSTIRSCGLGVIADAAGWGAVLTVFIAFALLAAMGSGYMLLMNQKKRG